MKTLVVFLSLAFFCLATIVSAQAAGAAAQPGPAKKQVVNYNAKYQCVMVCKGEKPALEVLEDGLAYALDIPLALLSPITTPVVYPILYKYDSGPDRTYYGRGPVRK